MMMRLLLLMMMMTMMMKLMVHATVSSIQPNAANQSLQLRDGCSESRFQADRRLTVTVQSYPHTAADDDDDDDDPDESTRCPGSSDSWILIVHKKQVVGGYGSCSSSRDLRRHRGTGDAWVRRPEI